MPRLPGARHVFYAALRADLIAAAEHQFRLDAPDKTGHTARRAIRTLLERHPGRADLVEQITGPAFPTVLFYLYRWHSDLRRRCGGGMGLSPISWEAMEAWSRVTRHRLTPWEAQIIGDLDDRFLIVMSENKTDG